MTSGSVMGWPLYNVSGQLVGYEPMTLPRFGSGGGVSASFGGSQLESETPMLFDAFVFHSDWSTYERSISSSFWGDSFWNVSINEHRAGGSLDAYGWMLGTTSLVTAHETTYELDNYFSFGSWGWSNGSSQSFGSTDLTLYQSPEVKVLEVHKVDVAYGSSINVNSGEWPSTSRVATQSFDQLDAFVFQKGDVTTLNVATQHFDTLGLQIDTPTSSFDYFSMSQSASVLTEIVVGDVAPIELVAVAQHPVDHDFYLV